MIVFYILFYLSLNLTKQKKKRENYSSIIFLNFSCRYIMVGYDPKKKDLTNSQILIASTTSGFISRFILQPIDVIKIRLQVRLNNSILILSNI